MYGPGIAPGFFILTGRRRMTACSIDLILFDFGGVLAEEGFVNGLKAMAVMNGLDPDTMVKTGFQTVHDTGFVVGRADEATFWHEIRRRTGIRQDDTTLRQEMLSRFVLRTWMFEIIRDIRSHGVQVGILSDQTLWLEELDDRFDFFRWFDHVFSSYHMGKSKRDPSIFDDIAGTLNLKPGGILFIDDHEGNCKRARSRALKTILYVDEEQFLRELKGICFFVDTRLYNVFM